MSPELSEDASPLNAPPPAPGGTKPRRRPGRHSIGASTGAAFFDTAPPDTAPPDTAPPDTAPPGARPIEPGPIEAHGLVPPSRWLTVLAFAMVVVPFGIILGRLVLAPGQHLYLPDDLALIDLHTRRALAWKQQLGVFDHNNWNHPGPSYFYLLSIAYRVFGAGARAMFIGATLINALAAVACVGVVRRRATPARALWAAGWVCVLASLMATVSPGSVTYSEGALGALVSPWNPTVVIFPLLLLILLCAAALDRSSVSLVGAVLVGSFVVQTNISCLPLVVALVGVTSAVWAVTLMADRWGRADRPSEESGGAYVPRRSGWRGWIWAGLGLVVLAAMWLPPTIQQLSNHPGNMTLVWRFFTAGHKGQSLAVALKAMAATYGVLLVGPSGIMSSYLGHSPYQHAASWAATAAALAVGAVVTVVGIRQRVRFAAAVGALSLVGAVTMVVAVTHVVGIVFGYLVIWAITVPVAALIGVGMVRPPTRSPGRTGLPVTAVPGVRIAACAVGVIVSAVLCVRVVALPALAAVSDPHVGALVSLVRPELARSASVFVGDAGAGTADTRLLDTEEFIGLVNRLDQLGYHPKVNAFWRVQFGPGYHATGKEDRRVELSTWTTDSTAQPGFLGRVGDVAVTVTTADGNTSPPATGSAQ